MAKLAGQDLTRLTWDDLNAWAGADVVRRGREYARGHVSHLDLTEEGFPVAWVRGTRRYATLVRVETGRLVSECSCAYGRACKHAVALVLSYLDCLKRGVKLDTVLAGDPRLAMLERQHAEDEELGSDFDDEDVFDADDDFDEDEQEDEEQDEDDEKDDERSPLREYLERQTKARLVALLDEAVRAFPDVRRMLEDRQRLESGDVNAVVAEIRKEIADVEEPEWNGRYGHGETSADFGRLRMLLDTLAGAGHVDRAMGLAEELLEAGVRAVENYDHDGDVAFDIGSCLGVAFAALPHGTLSPVKQLEWVEQMQSEDQYDLCDSAVDAFWKAERPPKVWNALVTALEQRLKASGRPKPGNEGFSARRRRDQLVDRLVVALRGAGRDDEIIALCEREATITGSYERLVKLLVAAERWQEVLEWCRRAIEAGVRDHYWTEEFFRATATTACERLGDHAGAAALRADHFFTRPEPKTFSALLEAADRVKVKKPVEKAARRFLETGELPEATKGSSKKASWPLPLPGLAPAARDRSSEAPLFTPLVEIAMAENKPDDVLKWYDLATKGGRGAPHVPLGAIAGALRAKYPDRAVEILKRLVDEQLQRADVKAYSAAAESMRMVRDTFLENGRDAEWQTYLARIRDENRRRPRCIEILRGLDSRPIIDLL
jgi:uncharacterized Zn finger protein